MHCYETVFILRPDLAESKVKETVDQLQENLAAHGGQMGQVEEWGMRDLAYVVKKQTKGIYVVFQYEAEPSAVRELDRRMKLCEEVIRHISIRKASAPRVKNGEVNAQQQA